MDKFELRARREALGLTQTELATTLGVALRTYQEWEAGARPIRNMVELALYHIETSAAIVRRWRTN